METLLLSSTFSSGSKYDKEKKNQELTILYFVLVGVIFFNVIYNQQNLIIRYHIQHPWHV